MASPMTWSAQCGNSQTCTYAGPRCKVCRLWWSHVRKYNHNLSEKQKLQGKARRVLKNQRAKQRKEAREQERQKWKSLTLEERQAIRTAHMCRVSQSTDINNVAITGQGATGLLTLPPEIRNQIYDAMSLTDGVVEVTATRPVFRYQNLVGVLQAVCRLLRDELETYSLTHHTFRFKTDQALSLWCRKHSDKLRLITKIELLGSPVPLQIADKDCFQNLRCLLVDHKGPKSEALPDNGDTTYDLYRFDLSEYVYQFCPSRYTLLLWRHLEIVLDVIPQFRDGCIGSSMFHSFMGKHRVWFRCKNSPADYESNSWQKVDIELTTKNLDMAVKRLREVGGCDFETGTPALEDFISKELGRPLQT